MRKSRFLSQDDSLEFRYKLRSHYFCLWHVFKKLNDLPLIILHTFH